MPVRKEYEEKNLSSHGAYELVSSSDAKVSIFASGSEVEIAVKAAEVLEGKGIATRVVSVPCVELFFEQSEDYREAILAPRRSRLPWKQRSAKAGTPSSVATAPSSA